MDESFRELHCQLKCMRLQCIVCSCFCCCCDALLNVRVTITCCDVRLLKHVYGDPFFTATFTLIAVYFTCVPEKFSVTFVSLHCCENGLWRLLCTCVL